VYLLYERNVCIIIFVYTCRLHRDEANVLINTFELFKKEKTYTREISRGYVIVQK